MRDPVLLHGAQDVDERSDIVLEIEQRLANRLRDRLERREMDHRIDRSRRREDVVSRREIAEIDVVVRDVLAGDRPHAVDGGGMRADAIVDRQRLEAVGDELDERMAPDVAGFRR